MIQVRNALTTPRGLVLVLIAVQIVAWSVIPTLVNTSPPLDVTREGLSWGHEFQWGYSKHPPLASWALEAFFRLFGDFGLYLIGQLAVTTTLWCVYCLGRRIFDEPRAAVGALLLCGLYYFSWPSSEFNHNIAEMPFWAAGALTFHRCINEGKARDWLLLGLIAGLGILTKYVFAVLLVMMALFVLLTPRHRRLVLSPWPYAAALVMAIILVPHVLWLTHNDFMPLRYLNERAETVPTLLVRVAAPLKFLVAQLVDHLPMLAMVAIPGLIARGTGPVRANATPENTLFLWIIGFGPALLTVGMAMVSGRLPRDMWGAPMWNMSGLIIVNYFALTFSPLILPRLFKRALFLVLTVSFAFGVAGLYWDPYARKPVRTNWPDRELAAELEAKWHQVSSCPLRIVVGDNWLTGLVGIRASERPSVLIDGDFRRSPWITPDRVAKQGAIIVWQLEDNPGAGSNFAAPFDKKADGVIELPWPRNPKGKPLQVAYAILVPECR